MSELTIYILSGGLTILAYMFLPVYWFYTICISILFILLLLLYNSTKKQKGDISPYLLSGVSAVFGLIAIFIDFSTPPAALLAIFFLLSSLIKVLFKEEASTKKTHPPQTNMDVAIRTETQSQTQRNQGLDRTEDLLINLGKKMDQTLTEIYALLRSIDGKGLPNSTEIENTIVEKIRESLTKDMISFLNKNQEQMNTNWNMLNSILDDEFKMVKNSLSVLVNTMAENKRTQEDIQNSLEIVKQKSLEIPTIDMIREVVTESIKQNDSSFEVKHIQNYEIKNYFYRALEEANHEVCIISPWIAKWVITDPDILLRFENLLKRGVNLNILYGIEGSSSSREMDNKNDRTEQVVNQLRNKLTKKGYKGKLRIGKINSHYKLFICDDKFYVESSMNILSNKGDYGEGFVWHEGGQYSENKKMLKALKNIYFWSNNYYSVM